MRGNRATGKQETAPNRRQHPPKHKGRSRARQGRPWQRKQKGSKKSSSPVGGGGVSWSAWTPIEPPSRQWCMKWPSQDSEPFDVPVPEHRNGQWLTQKMRDAHSLDDLLNVIIRTGDAFNHVHTTAALRYLHSKLRSPQSASSMPTYSEKMIKSRSAEWSSPLLGGEPMCMYIGDVSEAPLPRHGPVTWDSHAVPPETSPSLEELYAHEAASEAMQGVLGFPPQGRIPGMPLPILSSECVPICSTVFGPLWVNVLRRTR